MKRLCSVDGCGRVHMAQGFCKLHYRRARGAGTISPMPKRSVEERFWSRVDKGTHLSDCWVWTGGHTGVGYGTIVVGRRPTLAHRWAYEALVGPIPDGLELDHLCRNRGCVRPDHLEPVTRAENIRRGLQGILKTHCKRGHPWVPENIRTNGWSNGRRAYTCRLCTHERQRP